MILLVVDSLCFEGAYNEVAIEESQELFLVFYRRLAVAVVVVVPNNLLARLAIVKKSKQQEHLDRIVYS